MAAESHTTTDHDEIRRWVEEHEGNLPSVKGTETGDGVGVLRIDFLGGTGEDQLEHIGRVEKFEQEGLAFLYQDRRRPGRTAGSSSSSRAEACGACGRSTRAPPEQQRFREEVVTMPAKKDMPSTVQRSPQEGAAHLVQGPRLGRGQLRRG